MQPLGRKPIRFPGKTDCHPKDGHVNWWENIYHENKAADIWQSKKEIIAEVLELDEMLKLSEFLEPIIS